MEEQRHYVSSFADVNEIAKEYMKSSPELYVARLTNMLKNIVSFKRDTKKETDKLCSGNGYTHVKTCDGCYNVPFLKETRRARELKERAMKAMSSGSAFQNPKQIKRLLRLAKKITKSSFISTKGPSIEGMVCSNYCKGGWLSRDKQRGILFSRAFYAGPEKDSKERGGLFYGDLEQQPYSTDSEVTLDRDCMRNLEIPDSVPSASTGL
jgi:hypothetical protein